MIKEFSNLPSVDVELLYEVPLLITVLIAGADDNIDKDETNWAERISNYRRMNRPASLNDYYGEIAHQFQGKLERIIERFPPDVDKRAREIGHELKKLNVILEELPQIFAYELYTSYRTFAKQVAKASGGFLGFGAVSYEESKWVDLPMIREITKPEGYKPPDPDEEWQKGKDDGWKEADDAWKKEPWDK